MIVKMSRSQWERIGEDAKWLATQPTEEMGKLVCPDCGKEIPGVPPEQSFGKEIACPSCHYKFTRDVNVNPNIQLGNALGWMKKADLGMGPTLAERINQVLSELEKIEHSIKFITTPEGTLALNQSSVRTLLIKAISYCNAAAAEAKKKKWSI